MNVLVLAAGEGTRLRPFTENRPKPLIPLLGTQLANYSLALIDNLEIDNLVFNAFYLPEQIRVFLDGLKFNCRKKVFSLEAPNILGSGGAIWQAHQSLINNKPFIVMNGDELILPEHPYLIKDMLGHHRAEGAIATLLTMDHPEVGGRFGGAWCKSENTNEVALFAKKSPGMAFVGRHYLGVAVIDPNITKYMRQDYQEENLLYESLTKAIECGERVVCFNTKPMWYETGNPTDFIMATESLLNLLYSAEPSYYREHLKQVVAYYGQGGAIVERGTELEMKVKEAFYQIKEGKI